MNQIEQFKRSDYFIALNLFLVMLALYCLTASGRMDTIDGQYRYDVTRSLLDGAGFQIRDPSLLASKGVDGKLYGDYGPIASLLALPLCALGRLIHPGQNTEMFFFSLTSPVISSFCVVLFFLMRRRMGSTPRNALFWSLALAVTTPLWPLATSVFHQPQQASFMLLGLYLAWESGLRGSVVWGVLAGLSGGALALFSYGMVVLVPTLGLASLEGMRFSGRSKMQIALEVGRRYLPFACGAIVPFALVLLFNYVRFGHPLNAGAASQPNHPPLWGNPVTGFMGLFFSPGKSIFLFFPPLVLSLVYTRPYFRAFPMLAVGLYATIFASVLLACSMTIWPSEWAWGPRYLMFLAPLVVLPFGLVKTEFQVRPGLIYLILGLGLLAQLMGILVEHLRFFLEQRVDGYFWYTDQGFYWRESQFFDRFAELYSVLFEGPPDSVVAFSGAAERQGLPTYTVSRAPPEIAHVWMRRFSVFYLPRPWPFWIPTLEPKLQPVNPTLWTTLFILIGAVGSTGIVRSVRRLTSLDEI